MNLEKQTHEPSISKMKIFIIFLLFIKFVSIGMINIVIMLNNFISKLLSHFSPIRNMYWYQKQQNSRRKTRSIPNHMR